MGEDEEDAEDEEFRRPREEHTKEAYNVRDEGCEAEREDDHARTQAAENAQSEDADKLPLPCKLLCGEEGEDALRAWDAEACRREIVVHALAEGHAHDEHAKPGGVFVEAGVEDEGRGEIHVHAREEAGEHACEHAEDERIPIHAGRGMTVFL